MQYAILADIHANLAALTAVLDDIEMLGDIDRVWCLGDIVGYGPEPHKCIQILKMYDPVCVSGNHDAAVMGKISLSHFSEDAAQVIEWTVDQLSAAECSFLSNLEDSIVDGKFTLVHGSPRSPMLEYVNTISLARENFACFSTEYCLCAHTHEPQIFGLEEDGVPVAARFNEYVKVVAGRKRLIINPGAVGQPRDGDPRASYAVYDDVSGVMQLRRVVYDVQDTETKILEAGLPIRVAGRLSQGR